MILFDKRYRLEQPWTEAQGGWLAGALDTKLNRNVLLWRPADREPSAQEGHLRRLGYASRFTDRRFVPILDVAANEDGLYAVLTKDKGYRLSERLPVLGWSGAELLERILSICPAMRDARRERLPDFAVTADNIWVDENNKLVFLNSWTEGEPDKRDVRGLALLLYQLASGSDRLPSSISDYNGAITLALADLPGGSSQDAVEWACSAFLPSCTLKDYESGIRKLLAPPPSMPDVQQPETKNIRKKTTAAAPVPLEPKQEKAGIVSRPKAESEPKRAVTMPVNRNLKTENKERIASGGTGGEDKLRRLRPWLIYSIVVFGIGMAAVLGLWLAIRQPIVSSQDNGPKAAVSPAPSSSAGPASTAPGASNGGTGSPSAGSVSPKPTATASKPSGGAAGDTAAAAGVVPDLTNHTLEEASQLALKAGLKYQYQLEPNDLPKGTVIRQEPAPGTAAAKGDRVVFWVSKGKS